MNDKLKKSFLNKLVNQKISVFLITGIQLKGKLLEFDEETILIDGDNPKIKGRPQLIFFQAISTIVEDESTGNR